MTSGTTEAEMQLKICGRAAEAHGVNVGAVREIIRMQDIAQVPRAPDFNDDAAPTQAEARAISLVPRVSPAY